MFTLSTWMIVGALAICLAGIWKLVTTHTDKQIVRQLTDVLSHIKTEGSIPRQADTGRLRTAKHFIVCTVEDGCSVFRIMGLPPEARNTAIKQLTKKGMPPVLNRDGTLQVRMPALVTV